MQQSEPSSSKEVLDYQRLDADMYLDKMATPFGG